MILVKTGQGQAKTFADLAKIKLTLCTINKDDKSELLEEYLVDYKFFKENIEDFLHNNNINARLIFKDYISGEATKTIEVEKEGKTEYTQEHDYFHVKGNFALDIPIVDNDRENIAKFITLISKLNTDIQVWYDINFTLSEELSAIMRAKATNTALDNIRVEVKGIADYLRKKDIDLKEINFTSNTSIRGASMDIMYKEVGVSMTEEEKIKALDDMLEGKEISVFSSFLSTWEIN